MADLRAEFHKRLVMVASILVLPFLALPFAIGRRRGQRAYRFGIALVILIAYHEIIQQGALITKLTGVSPYLTIWAPFAAAERVRLVAVSCRVLPGQSRQDGMAGRAAGR
jgi:lipopolysaccharide export LptBFGC system permease protein LptF